MADSSGILASTIFGCPISSYLALQSDCPATAIPPCATLTPQSGWDAGCCGSLSSYGTSLASCYSLHAPKCLDTSAITASVTGGTQATNVCAAFATGGAGSGGSASSAAAGSTAAASAASSTAAGSTATGGAASGGTTGGTATGSAATASSSSKSIAPKIGASLKICIGVALIGSLAVLSL